MCIYIYSMCMYMYIHIDMYMSIIRSLGARSHAGRCVVHRGVRVCVRELYFRKSKQTLVYSMFTFVAQLCLSEFLKIKFLNIKVNFPMGVCIFALRVLVGH